MAQQLLYQQIAETLKGELCDKGRTGTLVTRPINPCVTVLTTDPRGSQVGDRNYVAYPCHFLRVDAS